MVKKVNSFRELGEALAIKGCHCLACSFKRNLGAAQAMELVDKFSDPGDENDYQPKELVGTPDQWGSPPDEHEQRKQYPIGTMLLTYFPNAIKELSHLCYVGSNQHNPGAPVHWDRDKSFDHRDCMMRHFMDMGATDDDGISHTVKMAWRALALLEVELENGNKNIKDSNRS